MLILAALGSVLAVGLARATSSWQAVGSPGFSANMAYYLAMAVDSDNTPYVAYRDGGSSDKATVKMFNGKIWEDIGSPGFSAGTAQFFSLAFDSRGCPYVAYSDGGNSWKVTVKKFDGVSWQDAGSPGLSPAMAYYPSLALDSDNIPYVAYSDYGYMTYVTVQKFDGQSWSQVGSRGLSDGGTDYLSLALGSDNTPYVAYKDGGSSNKATVKMFDGESWQLVGDRGFSAGQADYVSLALDGRNRPYVAYRDAANGQKVTVKRFGPSGWENVGSPGFSAGQADYVSLALDSSGRPYVAYQDYSNSQKATVKRFDGTNWQDAGSPGFSAATAMYLNLALDSKNRPYVGYVDSNSGYKATVMRLESAEMTVLGNGQVIANGSASPSPLNHTDFGSINRGGAITRTFTISNSGGASLVLGAISFSNVKTGFTLASQPTSPVAAHSATTFQVTFSPAVLGPRTTTLTIANDDSTQNPYSFVLQGTGLTNAPVIGQGDNVAVTMSEDGQPAGFDLTLTASDPDGDSLTWSIHSQASQGLATASGAGESKAIGYKPAANYHGSDSFIVRVADDYGGQDTITVNVTIEPVNDAPVANAGPDQQVKAGALVTLNGSGSSDVDGDSLTYSWTQTAGPAVTLSNAFSARPTFTAPGGKAVLVFSLAVTDSFGLAGLAPDEVVIRVDSLACYLPLILNGFAPAGR